MNPQSSRRWSKLALVLAVVAAMSAPVAVFAAGGHFTDDDTSAFEAHINWMADAGITLGCNPPDNDLYCPSDSVTRGQMAAFMHRFAQYIDAEDGTPAEADHAADADTLDGLDSASFLKDDEIRITQSSGWLPNAGTGTTVNYYSNTDVLGAGGNQLALTTPSLVGADSFYLDGVEVCYDAVDAGDKITSTLAYRSTNDNTATSVLNDLTDRTVTYPDSECYTVDVGDSTAPADSAYRLMLTVTGSVRVFRVTSTYLPGGGGTAAGAPASAVAGADATATP